MRPAPGYHGIVSSTLGWRLYCRSYERRACYGSANRITYTKETHSSQLIAHSCFSVQECDATGLNSSN